MKALINPKQNPSEYPRLRELGGDVVLFTNIDEGVLVASEGRPEDIGEYTDTWVGCNFQDFKGTVTLSND